MSHVGRKTPISDHRVQEPAGAVFINPARYIYIYMRIQHIFFLYEPIFRVHLAPFFKVTEKPLQASYYKIQLYVKMT